MSWYAASVVSTVRLREGCQSTYPVYETIYLIEAKDFDEAEAKARAMGNIDAQAGIELLYCEQPAYREFIGIRKLKLTHNLEGDNEIGSARPSHGTEILECYFEVESESDLFRLANGKRVSVSYVDDDE